MAQEPEGKSSLLCQRVVALNVEIDSQRNVATSSMGMKATPWAPAQGRGRPRLSCSQWRRLSCFLPVAPRHSSLTAFSTFQF